MSKVKDGNYIVIQSFMVKDLQLKGNELLVYAIIYGFSQTEGQEFTGSLQYLAEWTNSTKQGIMKNLKSLVDKGLIAKITKSVNGVNIVAYYTTKFNGGMQQSLMGGIQQSLPNKISIDNIVNNQVNNTCADFEILWAEYPRKQGKQQALKAYQRAIKGGETFEDIQRGIRAYIAYIKRERIKPKYIKMGSTFFNGSCWADDYGQPVEQSTDLDDVF